MYHFDGFLLIYLFSAVVRRQVVLSSRPVHHKCVLCEKTVFFRKVFRVTTLSVCLFFFFFPFFLSFDPFVIGVKFVLHSRLLDQYGRSTRVETLGIWAETLQSNAMKTPRSTAVTPSRSVATITLNKCARFCVCRSPTTIPACCDRARRAPQRYRVKQILIRCNCFVVIGGEDKETLETRVHVMFKVRMFLL